MYCSIVPYGALRRSSPLSDNMQADGLFWDDGQHHHDPGRGSD
jgi:hypothetical protein